MALRAEKHFSWGFLYFYRLVHLNFIIKRYFYLKYNVEYNEVQKYYILIQKHIFKTLHDLEIILNTICLRNNSSQHMYHLVKNFTE